jgi:predicted transcriptional regulator
MPKITIDLDNDLLGNVKMVAGSYGVENFLRDLISTHCGSAVELTPEQEAAIRRGFDASERGNIIPHEEVFARIDKMLEEKERERERARSNK